MKQHVLLVVGVAIAAMDSSLVAQQPNGSHLASAIARSDMDTSVNACTDFFQFTNGGWLSRNPIPPGPHSSSSCESSSAGRLEVAAASPPRFIDSPAGELACGSDDLEEDSWTERN